MAEEHSGSKSNHHKQANDKDEGRDGKKTLRNAYQGKIERGLDVRICELANVCKGSRLYATVDGMDTTNTSSSISKAMTVELTTAAPVASEANYSNEADGLLAAISHPQLSQPAFQGFGEQLQQQKQSPATADLEQLFSLPHSSSKRPAYFESSAGSDGALPAIDQDPNDDDREVVNWNISDPGMNIRACEARQLDRAEAETSQAVTAAFTQSSATPRMNSAIHYHDSKRARYDGWFGGGTTCVPSAASGSEGMQSSLTTDVMGPHESNAISNCKDLPPHQQLATMFKQQRSRYLHVRKPSDGGLAEEPPAWAMWSTLAEDKTITATAAIASLAHPSPAGKAYSWPTATLRNLHAGSTRTSNASGPLANQGDELVAFHMPYRDHAKTMSSMTAMDATDEDETTQESNDDKSCIDDDDEEDNNHIATNKDDMLFPSSSVDSPMDADQEGAGLVHNNDANNYVDIDYQKLVVEEYLLFAPPYMEPRSWNSPANSLAASCSSNNLGGLPISSAVTAVAAVAVGDSNNDPGHQPDPLQQRQQQRNGLCCAWMLRRESSSRLSSFSASVSVSSIQTEASEQEESISSVAATAKAATSYKNGSHHNQQHECNGAANTSVFHRRDDTMVTNSSGSGSPIAAAWSDPIPTFASPSLWGKQDTITAQILPTCDVAMINISARMPIANGGTNINNINPLSPNSDNKNDLNHRNYGRNDSNAPTSAFWIPNILCEYGPPDPFQGDTLPPPQCSSVLPVHSRVMMAAPDNQLDALVHHMENWSLTKLRSSRRYRNYSKLAMMQNERRSGVRGSLDRAHIQLNDYSEDGEDSDDQQHQHEDAIAYKRHVLETRKHVMRTLLHRGASSSGFTLDAARRFQQQRPQQHSPWAGPAEAGG